MVTSAVGEARLFLQPHLAAAVSCCGAAAARRRVQLRQLLCWERARVCMRWGASRPGQDGTAASRPTERSTVPRCTPSIPSSCCCCCRLSPSSSPSLPCCRPPMMSRRPTWTQRSSGGRTGMASGRRWHASCARAKRTLTECASCSCPLCHAAAAAASVATAVLCWGRGGSVSVGVMHAPCCTAVIVHGHGWHLRCCCMPVSVALLAQRRLV